MADEGIRTDGEGRPARFYRRTWFISAATGVLAFMLGVGLGGSDSGETDAQATATPTVDAPLIRQQARAEAAEAVSARESELDNREREVDEREQALDEREQEVADREAAVSEAEDEKAAEEAANTIPGNGIYLVGTDIKPGQYRSTDNEFCYWARLSGTSGEFDEIIANANVTGTGVVTIKASDVAFETSSCSDWKRE